MAVLIIKSPFKYSPAGNPVVFTLSTSLSNVLLFKLELHESTTGTIIYTGSIYPTPVTPTIASINISKQLQSLVRYDVDNNYSTIWAVKSKPVISYYIVATEYGVTAGALVALGTPFTSSTFFAYDATLDNLNFNNLLTANSHVINSSSLAKFLTLQPDFKSVNISSSEQLAFISGGYTSLVASYNVPGQQLLFTMQGLPVVSNTTTPGTAEVRASSTITAGSTVAAGDNISVGDGTNVLFTYTATSADAVSNTTLIADLSAAFASNTYGYSVSNNSTTITVLAPPNKGAAGNSITLNKTLPYPTTSSTNGTGGNNATATLYGIGMDISTPIGATISVSLIDPTRGLINLLSTIYTTTDSQNIGAYINRLVALINNSSSGYSATQVSTSSFSVTARPNLGSSINGVSVDYYVNGASNVSDLFAGGTSGSTTTTNHSIIPLTISAFTGGVNGTPSINNSTSTPGVLAPIITLDVSPKSLMLNGCTHTFGDGDAYSVSITDSSGNVLTETRNYVFNSLPCTSEAVNVFWVNSFGVVDNYQFVQPQVSISTTKQHIQKNNLMLNNANIYSTNGVYNPANEIYKSTSKSSFKCWSQPLSDNQSNWFVDLVNSRQCYVELTNGQLVPVILKNSSYDVHHKKYIGGSLNQSQFEFEFDDDFTPSIAPVSFMINQQ